MIGRILRAAIARPWEYTGAGAPEDWEFRVSPDEETLAVYNPNRGRWFLFNDVIVLDQEKNLDRMDRRTRDWARFVEDLSDD